MLDQGPQGPQRPHRHKILVLRPKTRGIPEPWFVESLCLCGLLAPCIAEAPGIMWSQIAGSGYTQRFAGTSTNRTPSPCVETMDIPGEPRGGGLG